MPTLDDLRATFTDLEARAPAAIADSGHYPQHAGKRRIAVPLAATAVVLALVGGVVLSLGRRGTDGGTGSPVSTANPPATLSLTTYGFSLANHPAGTRLRYVGSQGRTQAAYLESPSGALLAIVSIFSSGAQPTAPPNAQRARVDGHVAWYGVYTSGDNTGYWSMDPGGPALMWQDRHSGVWVLIVSSPTNPLDETPASSSTGLVLRADLFAMANGVRIGETHPVRVPATLGYVPLDLRLGLVQISGQSSRGGDVDFGFSRSGSSHIATTISVLTSGTKVNAAQPDPAAEPITIGRYTGIYDPTQSAIIVHRGTTWISIRSEGLAKSELIKIVQGIVVAKKPTDMGTWFDAADAVK